MTPYDRIEKVIRYLDAHYAEQPQIADLAKVAGLSEFHFHRLFTQWAGTTPKDFLKFLTSQHAKALLKKSRGLLDVSLEAGLSGPGRLHDLLVTVEGVSPGEFKAQGLGLEIKYGFHPTPFGPCLVGLTRRGICHLVFLGEKKNRALALAELRRRWPKAKLVHSARETGVVISEIFSKKRKNKLSLHLSGTPFQIKVWEALLRIPQGRTLSYKDVAHAIGSPKAARAVGSAVGDNCIGYLIPCHRVIHETGIIGHYRWGRSRKRALLAWESSQVI